MEIIKIPSNYTRTDANQECDKCKYCGAQEIFNPVTGKGKIYHIGTYQLTNDNKTAYTNRAYDKYVCMSCRA